MIVFLLLTICSAMGENIPLPSSYDRHSVQSTEIFAPNTNNIIRCVFWGHHNSSIIYHNNKILTPTSIHQNDFVFPEMNKRTKAELNISMTYETAGKYQCITNRTCVIIFRAVVGPLTCEYIYDNTVCSFVASYDPDNEYDIEWNMETSNTTSRIVNNTIEFVTIFPERHDTMHLYIKYRSAIADRLWTEFSTTTPTIIRRKYPTIQRKQPTSLASVMPITALKYALLLYICLRT